MWKDPMFGLGSRRWVSQGHENRRSFPEGLSSPCGLVGVRSCCRFILVGYVLGSTYMNDN